MVAFFFLADKHTNGYVKISEIKSGKPAVVCVFSCSNSILYNHSALQMLSTTFMQGVSFVNESTWVGRKRGESMGVRKLHFLLLLFFEYASKVYGN